MKTKRAILNFGLIAGLCYGMEQENVSKHILKDKFMSKILETIDEINSATSSSKLHLVFSNAYFPSTFVKKGMLLEIAMGGGEWFILTPGTRWKFARGSSIIENGDKRLLARLEGEGVIAFYKEMPRLLPYKPKENTKPVLIPIPQCNTLLYKVLKIDGKELSEPEFTE